MRINKSQVRRLVREVVEEQEHIGVKVDIEQEDLLGDQDKMRAALLTMYPEKQVDIFMDITFNREPKPLQEALTKSEKDDVKAMVKKEIKKAVEDELVKALKTKDVKNDIADVTKKIMKKLYKDLSLQHPYIIDRIKL